MDCSSLFEIICFKSWVSCLIDNHSPLTVRVNSCPWSLLTTGAGALISSLFIYLFPGGCFSLAKILSSLSWIILSFWFCLFLYHLYKKKPPKDNKASPTIADAIIAPLAADDNLTVGFVDSSFECGVNTKSCCGTKSFVHIYSLTLLISSNKISLSIDWL